MNVIFNPSPNELRYIQPVATNDQKQIIVLGRINSGVVALNYVEFLLGDTCTNLDCTFSGSVASMKVFALPSITSFPISLDIGSALVSVDLSSLTSCPNTLDFSANTSLTSVNLSSLTSCAGTLTFSGATALASISLPSLTSCAGTLNLIGVNGVSIPKLTSINGYLYIQTLGVAVMTGLNLNSLTSFSGLLSFASSGMSTPAIDALLVYLNGLLSSGTGTIDLNGNSDPTDSYNNPQAVALAAKGYTVLTPPPP